MGSIDLTLTEIEAALAGFIAEDEDRRALHQELSTRGLPRAFERTEHVVQQRTISGLLVVDGAPRGEALREIGRRRGGPQAVAGDHEGLGHRAVIREQSGRVLPALRDPLHATPRRLRQNA